MLLENILYKPFAEKWLRGGTVWLYSDPHFNDPDMPSIRKNYINDEEQIKRINSKVGKKDTIIILGDIGDLEFIKKIKGYKVLIMGNHEKGASNYIKQYSFAINGTPISFKDKSLEKKIINGDLNIINLKVSNNGLFDEVYEGCLIISEKLILSHEPIENLPPYLFNIHGHDHSNIFTGLRHLNICAEHIDYTPINLSGIIKNGLLKDVESIHRITINKAIERKTKN